MRYTVGKPQKRRGQWACRIYFLDEGYRAWGKNRCSPEAATAAAENAARQAVSGAISVKEAIEGFLAGQRDKGSRDGTVTTYSHTLRRFFAPVLEKPLVNLKPARAAELYQALRTGGDALSVDSQRNYLAQAKTFCKWAVKTQLLKSNPLTEIEPVGRRKHGKPQPRRDEARKLLIVLLQEARAGDEGAVAALLAYLCALRASEIITRTVRDLDDGGRILWVDDTASGFKPKTDAGRRPVDVPHELQAALWKLTKDKLPGALLFVSPITGGQFDRGWPRDSVRRMCKKADVPIVCAHALRGLYATLAIRAGTAPDIVKAAMGHESVTTTLRSYATPGSEAAAQKERGLAALRGQNA